MSVRNLELDDQDQVASVDARDRAGSRWLTCTLARALSAGLIGASVALSMVGCGGDGGTNPTLDATSGGTTTPPAGGGTGGTTNPPAGGGTGGGTTTPPGGGTGGTGSGTTNPTEIIATWYGVQANIFKVYCTLCHAGASAPLGLSWEVDQYAAVVTNQRMSSEIPTLREVMPGNPDASYLIWKINGHGPAGEAIQGVRMPATGVALSQALIDKLTQWVRDGAPLGVPSDATSGGTTTPPSGGGGGGTTPPGGGGGGGGTTTPPASTIVPTWYGVQANIFQRFCTLCHAGASAPLGLSWEVGQYDAIVTNRRASSEIPSLREVEPNNPDASYVMWKLRGQGPTGQAIQGVRMPATGIALDTELISVVETWIRNGAPLGVPSDATAGGTPVPKYPVGSWMYVWTEALQVCTMCHSRTPSSERCGRDFDCPPKGVVLTADSYARVVDGEEVRPFRPDNSKLWERVTDNDPDKRMPFGLPALTQTQLDIIYSWIVNGAPLCPTGATCPP